MAWSYRILQNLGSVRTQKYTQIHQLFCLRTNMLPNVPPHQHAVYNYPKLFSRMSSSTENTNILEDRKIQHKVCTAFGTSMKVHTWTYRQSVDTAKPVNMSSWCRHFHNSCNLEGVFEDNQTKAVTVWSSIKQVHSSPLPALSLALSGLIPFVGVPAYMILQHAYLPSFAFAQVAYGASILAFLGGVRWGFTIPEENSTRPDWPNLGYSVTLSLVAFGGLLLSPPYSLFTVMGRLTFAGYMDMAMYGYPPWFKGLRFILSFIAVLSLWTTFMCGFLLPHQEPNE